MIEETTKLLKKMFRRPYYRRNHQIIEENVLENKYDRRNTKLSKNMFRRINIIEETAKLSKNNISENQYYQRNLNSKINLNLMSC